MLCPPSSMSIHSLTPNWAHGIEALCATVFPCGLLKINRNNKDVEGTILTLSLLTMFIRKTITTATTRPLKNSSLVNNYFSFTVSWALCLVLKRVK